MIYTFILKNEKTKNYRLISQLLVFFNLLGFILLLIQSENHLQNNFWLLISIVFTAFYIAFVVVNYILKKKAHDFWHRALLAYCALAWTKTPVWWLSLLNFSFIALDYFSMKKKVVRISEKKIQLAALIKKKAEWSELNNLVLKDGLLTIDFKNNRLFQHLVYESDPEVEEKAFNEFCRQQLKKSEFYSDN